MDDTQRRVGADILRMRWMDRMKAAEQRLKDPKISDLDRALEERERSIYEMVLHEFVARLGLSE
jgi:hypothetical protein